MYEKANEIHKEHIKNKTGRRKTYPGTRYIKIYISPFVLYFKMTNPDVNPAAKPLNATGAIQKNDVKGKSERTKHGKMIFKLSTIHHFAISL